MENEAMKDEAVKEEELRQAVLTGFIKRFPAWGWLDCPTDEDIVRCGGQDVYMWWSSQRKKWQVFVGYVELDTHRCIGQVGSQMCIAEGDTPEEAVDEFARLCSGIVRLMKFAL